MKVIEITPKNRGIVFLSCPDMGLHKKPNNDKRRNVGRSRRTFTETLKRQGIDYYQSNYCTQQRITINPEKPQY